MELVLYKNFSKEVNSTKRPAGTGTTVQVYLKDNTSVIAPTFMIDGVDLSYNYCKWNNRYYFINDIVLSNRNIYELQCTLDVLATWKTEIGNSTQYVIRSASSYNGLINDTMYPAKNLWTYAHEALSSGSRFGTDSTQTYWNANMFYVIGCVGTSTLGADYAVGSTTYYALDPSACAAVFNTLMTDDTYLQIDTLEPGLQKALVNPLQYITSCIAVPGKLSNLTGATQVSSIRVGWWDIHPSWVYGGTMMAIPSTTLSHYFNVWTKTFTLEDHPDVVARHAAYLNFNDWTHHSLYIEPYGLIQIDSSDDDHTQNLTIKEDIDLITGVGRLLVYNSLPTGHKLISYNIANLGVPIQVSQMSVDKLNLRTAQIRESQATAGIVSAGAGAIGSFLRGDAVGGIQGTMNTISQIGNEEIAALDAKRAEFPITEKSGQNGTFVAWNTEPLHITKYVHPVDDDPIHLGRPLYQDVKINTLSGYIQTSHADLSINGLATETEMIKSLMNGGFYYE